mmetsp:Transcript_117912/g.229256  ORF Transcript_117912/g.229256 Transcript_117912/m.229256 type:complete len:379 (+) Transcript_117912:44-1180(+)
MLEKWHSRQFGAVLGGVVVLLLCACNLGSDGVAATGQGQAFALSVAQGANFRSLNQWRNRAVEKATMHGQSTSMVPDTMTLATGSAFVLAAFLAVRQAGHSRIARRAGGIREPQSHTYERKWWSIKEDRDPTTLPLWQRDVAYGYKYLRGTMIWGRRKQIQTFWDVRVLKSKKDGCLIEMLNSGLLAWCPVNQEGPQRLTVGDIVKMECTACPTLRVNHEQSSGRHAWLKPKKMRPDLAVFSHWNYITYLRNKEKAEELKAGDIIECTVFKQIGRGLLMELPGEPPKAHGMLAMMDISRLKSSTDYVAKMFPKGTKMKCYVIHSCAKTARITLGTKEFEDDDHMGWMLSFPERVMKDAERGAKAYEEKRKAYIEWLQK